MIQRKPREFHALDITSSNVGLIEQAARQLTRDRVTLIAAAKRYPLEIEFTDFPYRVVLDGSDDFEDFLRHLLDLTARWRAQGGDGATIEAI